MAGSLRKRGRDSGQLRWSQLVHLRDHDGDECATAIHLGFDVFREHLCHHFRVDGEVDEEATPEDCLYRRRILGKRGVGLGA
jgi:hypothetical protein